MAYLRQKRDIETRDMTEKFVKSRICVCSIAYLSVINHNFTSKY